MDTGKIAKVATITKSEEQQSAQVFKASQAELQGQTDQLEQLLTFKQEYETRLETLGGQGIQARQLQDYRCFLDKLNQAIESQRQVINKAEQTLQTDHQGWQQKSQRHSAMENLIDVSQQKIRDKLAKSEQNEADDRYLAGLTP